MEAVFNVIQFCMIMQYIIFNNSGMDQNMLVGQNVLK